MRQITTNDWTSILTTWLPLITHSKTQDEKIQAARVVGSCLACMSRELTPQQKASILQSANLHEMDAQQYEQYFMNIVKNVKYYDHIGIAIPND